MVLKNETRRKATQIIERKNTSKDLVFGATENNIHFPDFALLSPNTARLTVLFSFIVSLAVMGDSRAKSGI